ncbi:hypothetical protein N1851_006768 [Merluccius polli]|uniref:Uncharacterized protein n=1 Tax=Merluccius polli TaxID=89951 RepID=A0AA47N3S1_MERPO|nr:hypothetical protein N1851_006768 [Merluccius polli]
MKQRRHAAIAAILATFHGDDHSHHIIRVSQQAPAQTSIIHHYLVPWDFTAQVRLALIPDEEYKHKVSALVLSERVPVKSLQPAVLRAKAVIINCTGALLAGFIVLGHSALVQQDNYGCCAGTAPAYISDLISQVIPGSPLETGLSLPRHAHPLGTICHLISNLSGVSHCHDSTLQLLGLYHLAISNKWICCNIDLCPVSEGPSKSHLGGVWQRNNCYTGAQCGASLAGKRHRKAARTRTGVTSNVY